MKRTLKISSLLLLLSIFFGSIGVTSASFTLVPQDHGKRQLGFEVKPGEKATGAVVLQNLASTPITINLYGADATQSNLGTFALTTSGTEQRHIGKWVTFKNPSVKLDASERREVGFEIAVPEKATPGVYGGGIAAESMNETGSGKGSAVSIASRVVVKLFISVPGDVISKYSWNNFSYAKVGGNVSSFSLEYKNEGNTVFNVSQKIVISGFPMGEKTIDLPSAVLLQGSDLKIPAKWGNEPFFGFYTAKAIVTFSELDIMTNKEKPGTTVTKEVPIYIPLKLETLEGKITVGVIAFLILLITLVAYMLISRFLFRKKCSPYTVATGDSIVSIADTCKVNWKKLARANKLRAPYNLKAGQKIIAPPTKKK